MEQHQCPVTANTTLVEVNVAHRIDNCEVAAFSEEIKNSFIIFSFWLEQRLFVEGTPVHLRGETYVVEEMKVLGDTKQTLCGGQCSLN